MATLDQFPKLTSLVADNNELDDGFALPQLPQLRTLSLNNNKLADLEKLIDNLKQAAPQLQYLSLLKNPACPNDLLGGDDEDYNRYRFGADPPDEKSPRAARPLTRDCAAACRGLAGPGTAASK